MNRPVDTDWTPQFAFTKRFWVGCVTMLVATSFLVIAIVTALDARALAQNPRTLTATVVDTHEVGSSFGAASDPKFKITYQFRFDDQALRMTRTVPEAFFRAHPIDATWDIQVHSTDPSIHDLYAGETRSRAWGFIAVFAILAGIGAAFALSAGNLNALRARLFL